MKIATRANLRASPFDPERWKTLEPTATRDFAGTGIFDRYAVDLHSEAGQSREMVLGRALDALMAYRIFPPGRMRACVCTPDGRIALGATIVQRVFVGTLALETAVRVVDTFEEDGEGERRTGFTYATLQGHPERGISTFAVHVRKPTGELTFTIEAWSRAGHWLAVVGRPLSRWMQKSLTREAIAHFARSVGHEG